MFEAYVKCYNKDFRIITVNDDQKGTLNNTWDRTKKYAPAIVGPAATTMNELTDIDPKLSVSSVHCFPI